MNQPNPLQHAIDIYDHLLDAEGEMMYRVAGKAAFGFFICRSGESTSAPCEAGKIEFDLERFREKSAATKR